MPENDKCMKQIKMRPNFGEHYLFYNMTFQPYQQFMLVPVGSWNYNCADEHSDVDTKAIFIPTLRDIVENKREAYTHLLPNEEHIDCCDIRSYMTSLIKGNPQFLETLFSNWGDLNTGYYGEEIHTLIHMREDIARCNPNNTIRALLGMADRNYKLCISRGEEDHLGKWVYQLVRIEECMDKYRQCRDFDDCLHTDKRDFLLSLKNNEYNKEVLTANAEAFIARCHNHYDSFISMNNKENKWTQYQVEQIVMQVIRKSIEKFDKS